MHPFLVPEALVAAGVGGNCGQRAGQDDVEEGAEVVEAVFHRSAGEAEARLGVESAQRSGGLAAAVLGVLGFVGDEAAQLGLGEEILVAHERAVGGDDHVVFATVGRGGEAGGAVVDEHAQLRGEAGELASPVFGERGGADDERSGASRRFARGFRVSSFEFRVARPRSGSGRSDGSDRSAG